MSRCGRWARAREEQSAWRQRRAARSTSELGQARELAGAGVAPPRVSANGAVGRGSWQHDGSGGPGTQRGHRWSYGRGVDSACRTGTREKSCSAGLRASDDQSFLSPSKRWWSRAEREQLRHTRDAGQGTRAARVCADGAKVRQLRTDTHGGQRGRARQ
jgi:hypothetical protein